MDLIFRIYRISSDLRLFASKVYCSLFQNLLPFHWLGIFSTKIEFARVKKILKRPGMCTIFIGFLKFHAQFYPTCLVLEKARESSKPWKKMCTYHSFYKSFASNINTSKPMCGFTSINFRYLQLLVIYTSYQ